MTNFTAWAQETKTVSRRCKVCSLPDDWYRQVVEARNAGYGTIIISKFLADNGFSVTSSSLENHFARGGGHGR